MQPSLSLLWFNSSPLGQNGRHFADGISECISLNEKFCILIKISLKFVPNGPIGPSIGLDNGLAPKRRQAIIWTNADPTHWRIYAALGVDELTRLIFRAAFICHTRPIKDNIVVQFWFNFKETHHLTCHCLFKSSQLIISKHDIKNEI